MDESDFGVPSKVSYSFDILSARARQFRHFTVTTSTMLLRINYLQFTGIWLLCCTSPHV
jgi:hypothetical protein